MVWSGPALLHAKEFAKLLDYSSFEAPTLVAVNAFWYAIMHNVSTPKCLCHRRCRLIPGREGLCVSGEVIGYDQDVFYPTSWRLQAKKIEANQFKWPRTLDRHQWGFRFWFFSLSDSTSSTSWDVLLDNSFHTWVEESVLHESQCPLNTFDR